LKGADVVVNCVLYYYNLHVMRACLKAGVHYVDLGGLFHMTRKQLRMHSAFKKKGLTGVLGCGATPGITNVMAAYGARAFDSVQEVHISFGDADFTHYDQPFVLPYTMHTLFDEFTKKPAVVHRGRLRFVAARSGELEIRFPAPVGKQKGFYSLHSELATLPQAFGLKECSFRVTFDEKFIAEIEFLIDAGLASDAKVNGIAPRDVTAQIMDQWLPRKGTRVKDVEYLRVEMKGRRKGKAKELAFYCKTMANKRYNIPAGTYDTAVPASIVAQMIMDGEIAARGVMAPESCVEPELFFKELHRRGLVCLERKK
jgi:saccharopine dehydrogenase-like NADP-dependent oxidoreductase